MSILASSAEMTLALPALISCWIAASAPALSSIPAGAAALAAGGSAGYAAVDRLAAGGAASGGDREPRPGAWRFDFRDPARCSISGTEH